MSPTVAHISTTVDISSKLLVEFFSFDLGNKLKSLKVAKSKDDDAVCDGMYDSVCV